MSQIISIPRDTGKLAAEQLRTLEGHPTLSDEQALELLAYLQETKFEPLHWCLGELAATLLRDRATAEIKARIWDLCETADHRRRYFYLLALSNEKQDWLRLKPHLERALDSDEGTLRAFASELLWSQPPHEHAGRVLNADSNLLFGILALQMDFINRDALIAAMNAWVLDKKKPLSQILLDQGAYRPEDHQLLEVVIKRHLELHYDDAAKSLASLSAIDSVQDELERLADPELRASLAHVAKGESPYDTTHITRSGVKGKPSVPPPRFLFLRPHAEGGLGKVSVAKDQELPREVALKEIRDKYADDETSRKRFVLEAEVTGGLEHPGIVPVYGLGYDATGRPFYAMRFIQGENLHEAIRCFYAADEEKRDPGERSLAFRELLRQFVTACNALAYAHARGVLHRDVKPHNIMLGKYAETLVVDWGLAKVTGDRNEKMKSDEPALRPVANGTTPTEAGHVLGTPAYMSPEQAEGRLDLLNPASDIYSLGATLYELLTGHAPIQGRELYELLVKVKRGDWLPPRKIRKKVPVPLEAICCKAMALRPEARYGTALELAADIEHWLADEPVTAYREPWTGRLGRWVRRHPKLAAGAAGLLITAVAALAVSNALIEQEQARTRQQRDRAQHRFSMMLDTVDQFLRQITQSPEMKAKGVEQLRVKLVEQALAHYGRLAQEEGDEIEAKIARGLAYWQRGKLSQDLGRSPQAQQSYQEAIALFEGLANLQPEVPAHRQHLASIHYNRGVLYHDMVQTGLAKEAHDKALEMRKRLAAEYPNEPTYQQDLAQSQHNLGLWHQTSGHPEEAEAAYLAAVDIYKKLTVADPKVLEYQTDLADSFNNLGHLYRDTERLDESQRPFQDALAIYERLSATNPDDPAYHTGLATAHNSLGIFYTEKGHKEEAEKEFQEALRIRFRLVADHPDVPSYGAKLGGVYGSLADLKRETEYAHEALAWYELAISVLQKSSQRVPLEREGKLFLLLAHWGRADTLCRLERAAEAEPDWDEAVKLDNGTHNSAIRAMRAACWARAGEHARAVAEANLLADGPDALGDTLYNAASVFSLASNVIQADRRLRDEYAARAVELLCKAVAKGYQDAAHVKQDKDLDPLRSRPDFQKLLKELEAKAKQDGKPSGPTP